MFLDATANRDPDEAVEDGMLGLCLYHGLIVFRINLPKNYV